MSMPARQGRLRVIGGALKGRRIETLPGSAVRPTGDRVRGALFDILGPKIVGADFLDVYSGTGAVGIEALSRGASSVAFIEQGREAIDLLRRNLTVAGDLSNRATVIPADPTRGVPRLEREGRTFDLVFMDPPWSGGELDRGIRIVGRSRLLKEEAIVVGEHEESSEPPASDHLSPFRTARYGRTALTFYRLLR
ncbi:MAG TPA: 16S rRNA (guanine(966)-N(2))-methyltransferase RsmD [Candidatus Polarisedimenticolia bacterium]|jgi:16S rRNA (guanine(966)-N(2))-methyltransferase RsmD